MNKAKKKLSAEKQNRLLAILKARFDNNMLLHSEIKWEDLEIKLLDNNEKLNSLYEMEVTRGEPDVVLYNKERQEYTFFDCSEQSPKGRRGVCYDSEALDKRKENKPSNSAINMALEMGVDILSEEQYRQLQEFGDFDTQTSSWIKTSEKVRKFGGAIFCDRRYDTIFVYHNGAESYYSSRGFRSSITI